MSATNRAAGEAQIGVVTSTLTRRLRHPLPEGEGLDDMEYTPIKAPRGKTITCKGWHQEAAMRMLMNNLDEDVAENPRKLIVYGGSGRAARSWEAFHAIVECASKTSKMTKLFSCNPANRSASFARFPIPQEF